jgi:nitrate/nitrite-specific signal transduction histidine kinase
VGLRIMKERAHRIGGTLEVRSTSGHGTEVLLTLPVLEGGQQSPAPASPATVDG